MPHDESCSVESGHALLQGVLDWRLEAAWGDEGAQQTPGPSQNSTNIFAAARMNEFTQAGKFANINSSALFKFLAHVRRVFFWIGVKTTVA